MLFHLNNYLLPQRLNTATTTTTTINHGNNKPVVVVSSNKQQETEPATTNAVKLQSPKLNGPPDHVAFVIHGIGQQTEKFGFFQKHLQSLYDTTNKAVQENVPEKEINVQYIPIEWHKHIHEETDAIMDNITLRSIPTMRMVNNDYLADAFFYLSKERGQSIVNHVTFTFNEAYNQFIEGNPGFNGKVAILAYSLGGIITWDILSNQHTNNDNKIHSKLDLTFPKLDFKPDYLFTLGSPLSAFLTVRNQDPKVYHPDPSIVFENIFHPYDPLAYRFEPLLKTEYKNEPAVLVDTSCQKEQHQSSSSTVWSKGREFMSSLSRQQQKIVTLLSVNTTTSNKKEERQKQALHPGSTPLLFKSGNAVLSALKNYFSGSSSSTSITTQSLFSPVEKYVTSKLQQQEQEQDEEMMDSTTSTPKLSLDCGSEIEEDEDYFLVVNNNQQQQREKQQQKQQFMYIPHTDMTTTTNATSSNCYKRRHHFSSYSSSSSSFAAATNTTTSSSFEIGEEQHDRDHVNKRRRSNDDIRLLDTTITKGCSVTGEKEDHQERLPKRIDFVLQPEKFLGCFQKNEYFSGLTAHFSYWTHKDLMWHIVRRLENNNYNNTSF